MDFDAYPLEGGSRVAGTGRVLASGILSPNPKPEYRGLNKWNRVLKPIKLFYNYNKEHPE